MNNVMLVGATGATGQALMSLLLADSKVENIYLVHYRETGFDSQPKVTEIITELAHCSDVTIDAPIDTVFCCLGTTRKKAGSLAAFKRVDKDYIVNLGQWAKDNHASQLHVISSVGANPSSLSSYLSTKGETEVALKQLSLPYLALYQPTLLHGERNEFRLGENIAYLPLTCISKLPVNIFRKQKPIAITQLANAMYQTAKENTVDIQAETSTTEIISSLAIQQY